MGIVSSTGKNNDELIDNLIHSNYIRYRSVEWVMRLVDRGDYFPPGERDSAYKDLAWKESTTSEGAIHLSAPCIYANALEFLDFQPGQSFLNVGSGTGYLNTCAGFLLSDSGVNHGVELHEHLVDYARCHLRDAMSRPATSAFSFCVPEFFAGSAFFIQNTIQYDRIYCGALVPPGRRAFFGKMLKIGGVMVMPYGSELVRLVRTGEQTFTVHSVSQVSFSNLALPRPDAPTAPVDLPGLDPRTLQDACRVVVRCQIRHRVHQTHPVRLDFQANLRPPAEARRRTTGLGTLLILRNPNEPDTDHEPADHHPDEREDGLAADDVHRNPEEDGGMDHDAQPGPNEPAQDENQNEQAPPNEPGPNAREHDEFDPREDGLDRQNEETLDEEPGQATQVPESSRSGEPQASGDHQSAAGGPPGRETSPRPDDVDMEEPREIHLNINLHLIHEPRRLERVGNIDLHEGERGREGEPMEEGRADEGAPQEQRTDREQEIIRHLERELDDQELRELNERVQREVDETLEFFHNMRRRQDDARRRGGQPDRYLALLQNGARHNIQLVERRFERPLPAPPAPNPGAAQPADNQNGLAQLGRHIRLLVAGLDDQIGQMFNEHIEEVGPEEDLLFGNNNEMRNGQPESIGLAAHDGDMHVAFNADLTAPSLNNADMSLILPAYAMRDLNRPSTSDEQAQVQQQRDEEERRRRTLRAQRLIHGLRFYAHRRPQHRAPIPEMEAFMRRIHRLRNRVRQGTREGAALLHQLRENADQHRRIFSRVADEEQPTPEQQPEANAAQPSVEPDGQNVDQPTSTARLQGRSVTPPLDPKKLATKRSAPDSFNGPEDPVKRSASENNITHTCPAVELPPTGSATSPNGTPVTSSEAEEEESPDEEMNEQHSDSTDNGDDPDEVNADSTDPQDVEDRKRRRRCARRARAQTNSLRLFHDEFNALINKLPISERLIRFLRYEN